MKKLIPALLFAALFLAFAACSDEPERTAAPQITYNIQDEEVIVEATGVGEVILYADGRATTNPIIIQRDDQDQVHIFSATAQEEGKSISDMTTLELTIPMLETPNAFEVESEHGEDSETYLKWDIDMTRDSSSIYLYDIVFTIGEATSPAMTLRVDAPVTYNKTTKEYTLSGTGIVAYMMRGTTWMPMPGDSYLVNNLVSTINLKAKTYTISFDCHGGHFEKEGNLL